ncbi:isochorismate synthase [Arthrobacter ginkgonis]|uniref:isochorismate synthase n=1 Tax=Arthrobacter ginkgonis TaxID=1630594 RepID=A0ABP7CH37_9MICC
MTSRTAATALSDRAVPDPALSDQALPGPVVPAADRRAAGFRFASYGRALTGHGLRARLDPARARSVGLATAARDLLADAGPGAVLVGMIPFAPDADPHLYIPDSVEAAPLRAAASSSVSASSTPNPLAGLAGAENPGYRDAVARAVERIGSGDLSKVVLARSLDAVAGRDWDAAAVWERLHRQNPAGHSFMVRLPDGSGTVVGNSPELVAGVRHGRLSSHPLAGSAARQEDPAADRATASTLARSAKDLAEHAFVVDHIRTALEPLCADLDVPAVPDLLPTGQLWHLGTLVRGTLHEGLNCLDAALAVHPTPAICGTPVGAARAAIAELEPEDRGFYGGLVGWMDADGAGEWALLLRSAVLTGPIARLHAGAGIVAGSDPEAEHRETATKFGTMLAGLGITGLDITGTGANA